MRRRGIPVYPFLFSIWPPLALAAKNPLEIATYRDLLPALIAGAGVAATTYFLVWLVSRSTSRAGLACIVTSLAFWWFRDILFLLTGSPIVHALGITTYASWVVLLLTLGSAYLVSRRFGPTVEGREVTLNVFAAILVLVPLLSLARTGIQPELADLVRARPLRAESYDSSGMPDVYILILDSYAGHKSLLSEHGHDNRPFMDSLEARGFFVPRSPRANYTWTPLALASMLNWEYLDTQGRSPEMPAPQNIRDLAPQIIANRTVASFLERGYDFVFIPSTEWYTASHPWAHAVLPGQHRDRGAYSGHWIRMTPLLEVRRFFCQRRTCGAPRPWSPELASAFDDKFRALIEGYRIARVRPVLTIAHLMLPHEPYVYTSSCGARDPLLWPDNTDMVTDPELRAAYSGQVTCLNLKLLEFLDRLDAVRVRDNVVILQADHGQRYGLKSYSPGQAAREEWFDIFAAYRVPRRIDSLLYDTITPVVAFQMIVGGLTSDKGEVRPDRQFLSPPSDLFSLIELRGLDK